MSNAYVRRSDAVVAAWAEHKALMDMAAEKEMEAMFKRESLVDPVYSGNRAERRKQAALARRSPP